MSVFAPVHPPAPGAAPLTPRQFLAQVDEHRWSLGPDGVARDDTLVPIHADAPRGPALDALLLLARPGVCARLKGRVRTLAAELALGPLGDDRPPPDGLERVRHDGLVAARAAVAFNLATQDPPAVLPHLQDVPALPGLAGALVGVIRALAGEGPLPDDDAQARVEHADALLGPNPGFTVQEDRYAFAREDVGLMWCGLARSTDARAFDRYRSGYVILQECSPRGLSLSDHARTAWRDLLAAQPPGASDFADWQDQVCTVLDAIRAADRADRAVPAPRDEAAPAEPSALRLTEEQAQALAAVGMTPDDPRIRETVQTFAPDAARAGAVPGTVLGALLRAAGSSLDTDDALSLEGPLGEVVAETRATLATSARWEDLDLSEASDVLEQVVLQRLHRPDDLARVHAAWYARSEGGRVPVPREVAVATWVFLRDHPDPEAPARLDRALDVHADGQPRWTVDGVPTLDPAATLTARWYAHHGHSPRSRAWALRLVDLVGRLDAHAAALHAGRGSLHRLAGSGAPRVLEAGPDDVALHTVWRPTPEGPRAQDAAGHWGPVHPGPAWLRATVDPDTAALHLAWATADGQPPALPDDRAPRALPAETGDPLVLPDGAEAVLAEPRLDRTAQVSVVRDGLLRLETVALDAALLGTAPAPSHQAIPLPADPPAPLAALGPLATVLSDLARLTDAGAHGLDALQRLGHPVVAHAPVHTPSGPITAHVVLADGRLVGVDAVGQPALVAAPTRDVTTRPRWTARVG